MNPPSDPVLEAGLFTVYWALCHARNITCQPGGDTARQINELMEAIHSIPMFLMDWTHHDLDELRLHLSCFDHHQWPGAPDLVGVFEQKLAELDV
jgi:hypothetical protein